MDSSSDEGIESRSSPLEDPEATPPNGNGNGNGNDNGNDNGNGNGNEEVSDTPTSNAPPTRRRGLAQLKRRLSHTFRY